MNLEELVARAMAEALPLRWQRGFAQKAYEVDDCFPIARAALSALREAGAIMEWRPIAEAPKDGTPLLVSWPQLATDESGNLTGAQHGSICVVTEWLGGGWNEPDFISGHGLHLDDDWAFAIEPTHFMPLPKPPEDGR